MPAPEASSARDQLISSCWDRVPGCSRPAATLHTPISRDREISFERDKKLSITRSRRSGSSSFRAIVNATTRNFRERKNRKKDSIRFERIFRSLSLITNPRLPISCTCSKVFEGEWSNRRLLTGTNFPEIILTRHPSSSRLYDIFPCFKSCRFAKFLNIYRRTKFLLRVIKIRYSLLMFQIIDKVSLLRWKYQRFSREKEISSSSPRHSRSVIIQRNGNSRFGEGSEMGQREGGHALSQGRAFPANNCATESTRSRSPSLDWSIESRGNFGSTNQVGSLAECFTGGGLNTRQSVVSSLFADD